MSGSIVLVLLVFILSACNTPGQGTNQTASTNDNNSSSNPTTTIQTGPQSCPAAVSSTTYWDPIVPTQTDINHVAQVTCAHLLGNSSIQALITVQATGPGAPLDVYVYDHITTPNPNRIFLLQDLYKGEAKISGYDTLMTGEVNQNSLANKNQSSNNMTVDLYREFQWSPDANTLVPVAFPGFFPDMTRYQAENDQQQVNQGHEPWKLSATSVAHAFATDTTFLSWPPDTRTTVISGGGKSDTNAVIAVKNSGPGNRVIDVKMSRLEGKTNGIWIVTGASSPNFAINTPANNDRINSPITVKGTGIAFEGHIGKLMVLDSHYNQIGQSNVPGTNGNGTSSFSTKLSFNSTFKNGLEEGLIELYGYSNADGSIANAAMSKVMLMYSGS
jgi:hypothetical protein